MRRDSRTREVDSQASRPRGAVMDSLEARVLLSSDVTIAQRLLAEGFAAMRWHGQTIYVEPGEWLLRLEGLSGSGRKQLAVANKLLGRVSKNLKAAQWLGKDGLVLLKATKPASYGQIHKLLKRVRGYARLEPNAALWLETTANDPSYANGTLWGLNNANDADIDAPEAWDLTTGSSSVVVGVIDTGVDYRHPDLAANIWTNPGEIAGNRIDDDRNGYIDDIHGYDFANFDADPLDDHYHGTHVAGTIAGVGNNALGVTGVAWSAQIMALKFLSSAGSGSTSGAVAALNYATMMKRDYHVNIRLTNNSWGGGSFSQALYDAIAASNAQDMLFIAAAGNSGLNTDVSRFYPADYDLPNVISVAATDRNDARASFSNYGLNTVDLGAPGVEIWSTAPNGTYRSLSGTSMATPHVAGVAALAWSYLPSATAAQVRSAIFAGVDPIASMAGITVTGGRLNALGTLNNLQAPAPEPIAAPTDLAASAAGETRIDLSWKDNATNESGFVLERAIGSGDFVVLASLGANVTSYADTGLSAATTYRYRLRAVASGNFSDYSNEASATTFALSVPAAPTIQSALQTGLSVLLTWKDNANNESGFRIERKVNGGSWRQIAIVGPNITQFLDTNVRTKRTYYYRICAYNAAGNSAYSLAAGVRVSAKFMFQRILNVRIFSTTPLLAKAAAAEVLTTTDANVLRWSQKEVENP